MRKTTCIEVIVHRAGVVSSILTLTPDEYLDLGEPDGIDTDRFHGSLANALLNLRQRSKLVSGLILEPVH